MLANNFEELKNAIIDFYTVTGITTVLYDEYYNILYSYPLQQEAFCSEIRKTEALERKCLECDKQAFEHCKREKKLYVYQCHMGLIEAVSPIIEFDYIIGYLMMGQALPQGAREQVEESICGLPEDIPTSKRELRGALERMNCFSEATLGAAARIMDMCTCFISNRGFSLSDPEDIIYQIDRYINENISDSGLSVERICRRFLISRSTLYSLSKDTFGVGISERIRQLRIEKAKRLLTQHKLPISQISRQCGFNEPNYFTKTFKKATGVLPKDYK